MGFTRNASCYPTGDELIEFTTAQARDLFRKCLFRGKVMKRTIDVIAELCPMSRRCDDHRILATQVIGNLHRNGGVWIDEVIVAIERFLRMYASSPAVNAIASNSLFRAFTRLIIDREGRVFLELAHPLSDQFALAARQLEELALNVGRNEDVHRR